MDLNENDGVGVSAAGSIREVKVSTSAQKLSDKPPAEGRAGCQNEKSCL